MGHSIERGIAKNNDEKSDRLSRIVIGLAQDARHAQGIHSLFSRYSPFSVSRLVRMLCEGVMRGDRVLSMQCAVSLALLHPILSSGARRTIVGRLLPLLKVTRSKTQRTAAAYALQYSRSNKVIAEFKAMGRTRAGRLIIDDVLGLDVFAEPTREAPCRSTQVE